MLENHLSPTSGGASLTGGGSVGSAFAPLTTTSGPGGANAYANYRWKGIVINLPGPTNTVDLGLGGFRQKIANDYGIGYIGLDTTLFYDNVLRHNHHGTQAYAGQKPTVNHQDLAAVTIDLSRYGIPDGQIVVEGDYQSDSWNQFGPTTIDLGTFSYFQSLFNKRVDIKIGLLSNSFEYVGTFTAGSLNGGVFGPQGNLFGETGSSAAPYPTYGANVTVHITRNFYDKFGVSRGTSPLGIVNEHNYNPTGLNLSTKNSGAWVINETGYLRLATPGSPQTWVRTGADYSAGHYVEQDHPRLTGNKNYFLYLLADRQLVQISPKPGQAYRGIYAGFSIEYAPPNLNPFSQYYEARVYGLGLLPHRPFDQMSIVYTNTVFSDFLIERLNSVHQLTHTNSNAITGSYSFQVIHGFYLNGAVAYIDNPTPFTYTRTTGSALNLIGGASIYF